MKIFPHRVKWQAKRFLRACLVWFIILSLNSSFAYPVLAQSVLPNTSSDIPLISKPFSTSGGEYQITQNFADLVDDKVLELVKSLESQLASPSSILNTATQDAVLGISTSQQSASVVSEINLPKYHNGIDFAMPIGTQVSAVDGGVVTIADMGDYGLTVIVKHAWGESIYGHLSEVKVSVGQNISKGDIVALSGSTGTSTGPHLHFGIKPNNPDLSNDYFGFVDPAQYLGIDSVTPAKNQLFAEASSSASFEDVSANSDYLFNYKFNLVNGTSAHFWDKSENRAGFTVADANYNSKIRFFLKENQRASESAKFEANYVDFPISVGGVEATLRYTVTQGKVKEEIIIDQKPNLQSDELTWNFEMQVDDLVMEKQGAEYLFKSPNGSTWTLHESVYEDAAGQSGKVEMNITQTPGTCLVESANCQVFNLSLSLDKNLLETAAYPLIIDPTLTVTNNGAAAANDIPSQTNALAMDFSLPTPLTDTFVDGDGTGTTGAGSAESISAGNALTPFVMTAGSVLCANTDGTTAPTNIVLDNSGNCDAAGVRTVVLGSDSGATYNLAANDGILSVTSGTTTINQTATTQKSGSDSSSTTVNVVSTTGFAVNDIILIMQMKGGTPGNYDFVKVSSVVSATQLTVASTLANIYTQTTDSRCIAADTNCAQIVRIPRYTTVSVSGGTLTAPAWSTSTGVGGILWFEAIGAVSISGTGVVDMNGKGYGGAATVSGGTGGNVGVAGSAGNGPGAGGGGGLGGNMGTGGGAGSGGGSGGGGGGGNNAAGTVGTAGTSGTGGNAPGGGVGGTGSAGIAGTAGSSISPTITSRIVMGSGGGSGGSGHSGAASGGSSGAGGNGGAGGTGGGIIVLHSATSISNSATIQISGNNGSNGTNGSAGGNSPGGFGMNGGGGGAPGAGGGGGSAGSIWLNAPTVTAGTLTVAAGTGGTGGTIGGAGGTGDSACGGSGFAAGAASSGAGGGGGGSTGFCGNGGNATGGSAGGGGAGASGRTDSSTNSSLITTVSPSITFRDTNANSVWDSGEDLYLDADLSALYNADTLDAVTVANTGTAVNSTDISLVKLWQDNGDAVFSASTDTAIDSDCTYNASTSNWECDVSTQYTAAPRFFVTVNIPASPTNGATIKMSIPTILDAGTIGAFNTGDKGVFLAGNYDGPSSAVTNANIQTIVTNQNPSTPTSLGPTTLVDGSTGNDNTPTLTFTLADTDGADTVKYQIQIDDT
ncbi:MAG: M23 family metallopeptidase, partial [Bacteroidia bacterium]